MAEIVNYSMGICSAYIACRLQDECGKPICLFSDTKREDEDTYRFGFEVAKRWNLDLRDVSDGRDLWELFTQHNMIPARWMQDGPPLSELPPIESAPSRKGRRKLAMVAPAFSFDMGCDRCAVD